METEKNLMPLNFREMGLNKSLCSFVCKLSKFLWSQMKSEVSQGPSRAKSTTSGHLSGICSTSEQTDCREMTASLLFAYLSWEELIYLYTFAFWVSSSGWPGTYSVAQACHVSASVTHIDMSYHSRMLRRCLSWIIHYCLIQPLIYCIFSFFLSWEEYLT